MQRNRPFLQALTRCRAGHKQRALVASASSEQLLCLVECALNILRSRVPLQKRHLRRLKQQATGVREVSKSRSARQARQLLLRQPRQQSGRGLPALAGLLAQVLVPVLIDRVLTSSSSPST